MRVFVLIWAVVALAGALVLRREPNRATLDGPVGWIVGSLAVAGALMLWFALISR